jgi:hypothetical protein
MRKSKVEKLVERYNKKSKIEIPEPEKINIHKKLNGSDFAKIAGVTKTSISTGIDDGLIIADDNRKIKLIDNLRYLQSRYIKDHVSMTAEQRQATQILLARIRDREPAPPDEATPESGVNHSRLNRAGKKGKFNIADSAKKLKDCKIKLDENYLIFCENNSASFFIPVLEFLILSEDYDSPSVMVNVAEPDYGIEILFYEGDIKINVLKNGSIYNQDVYIKKDFLYDDI